MVIDCFTVLVQKLVDIVRCNVVVAPPVVYLDVARSYLINSRIKLCAQNVDVNVSGAFTGDISVTMLKDLNIQYVLIGHSERRRYHRESNVYVAQKFAVLHKIGLTPILCIGENQEEYDSGNTYLVCIEQIDAIIELLGVQAFQNAVIAYEPVWAIGSRVSAIPEIVQKTHKFIRDYIAQYNECIAKQVIIQYGGSVTPENVAQFLNQNDIDGVLVGAASLNMDSFVQIVRIAEKI